MDLVKQLECYKIKNKKLKDDEIQKTNEMISIITEHEKRRRKKLILVNYFSKLPIEILFIILFMNYKEECPRGHKWCGNDKPNHRYSNRQTIFRLMEVCKDWYHIISPKVNKKIVLNRGFLDFNEQKRSLQFTKLINSKNSFFINHIREIIIYDNFFFNSTMLKIVNICCNLELLVLIYSTSTSESLNDRFRYSDFSCSKIVFDNNSETLHSRIFF